MKILIIIAIITIIAIIMMRIISQIIAAMMVNGCSCHSATSHACVLHPSHIPSSVLIACKAHINISHIFSIQHDLHKFRLIFGCLGCLGCLVCPTKRLPKSGEASIRLHSPALTLVRLPTVYHQSAVKTYVCCHSVYSNHIYCAYIYPLFLFIR